MGLSKVDVFVDFPTHFFFSTYTLSKLLNGATFFNIFYTMAALKTILIPFQKLML